MNIVRRITTYILLVGVLGFTWLVTVLAGMIPRRRWKPTGRIIVTGTFFNPNWYLSHIIPLSLSGVQEVILAVDEPQLPLERVRFVCPPRWLSKIISRAGAKAIWMIIAGIRYRPDMYMGYHIVPGACTALIAGKLSGRPSCYQVTGAPLGIIGGFPETNGEGGIFLKPSGLLEVMALRVVRKFDYIVVRGNKAREYLKAHHIRSPIDIITGSVNCHQHLPQNSRDIHLIYIGRLYPVKQVDQFITILKTVSRIMPSVKAAIVGDGPLIEDLQKLTDELGLQKNVEFLGKRKDVEDILSRSKIFVLTSKSEGLSIAMAEAMAAGTVPVVADVGELGDLVIDGVNGYLVEPNNINEYTESIVSLLQDQALWDQYSRRAFEDAKRYCDLEVITGKWRRLLCQCVMFFPDFSTQKTANE